MAKIKQSKLNEIKGYNEYKKRKEEEGQKKQESAAQAASPSTTNTKSTSNTSSSSASTQKGAKIKQSKLDSIAGYNGYKARKDARERDAQVPPNSTPVADKTKLNDGYTIEAIKQNLGDSQTSLEDAIKRLESNYSVLTGSETAVTDFLKKYGATGEDIHDKMATKYGATLDDTGKYIFEDERAYNDYQKEIAALGALYDQYNANVDQYNALYNQYQDYAVDYEDWADRLENYQQRDATWKDILWNSLKQGYYNSLYGQESYKQMLGAENQADAYKELLSGEDYQFKTDGWLETGLSGMANQLGQQYRQWTDPRSLASGTAFATGAAIMGQTGPQIALPEEVITVPAAFFTGIQAGSAASNFEIEGGLAYQEMLEQGISPETARVIGLAVGGGNAALEALQADELIKGLKVFNNKKGYESVAGLIWDELKRRFPNVANQVLQEVAQEGVTIGGTQLGSYIDKGELAYTMPEVLERLGETALSSTLTFGMMDVPGAALNVVGNKANVNRLGNIGSEYKVDAEAVIAEGLELPKNTEAYKTATELKAKVDAGQTISDAELGRAVVANEMAIQQTPEIRTETPQETLENLARETVAQREKAQQAQPVQRETVSEQSTVPYNVMADETGRDAQTVATDVARVEQYATALGENGSRALSSVYSNEEISGKYAPEDIVHGFYDVYNEAMTGKTMSAEAKLRANALPENVRFMAVSSGKEDARRAVQAKYFGENAKLVRDDNWKKANISFKTSRKLDTLAKVLGVQVRFVDKIVVDQDGHEANAQYQNGEILISRNTALPVMTAAIHEAVHRLREVAPDAYTELSSFVLENMSDLGRDFNLAYRAELYQTDNRDTLTEEMVADAYGMVLEKSGMLDKMAKEHTTVLQRLADSIRDILRKIKKATSLEDLQLSQSEKDAFHELYSQLNGMERAMRNALKAVEKSGSQAYNDGNNAKLSGKESQYGREENRGNEETGREAEHDTRGEGAVQRAVPRVHGKEDEVVRHSKKGERPVISWKPGEIITPAKGTVAYDEAQAVASYNVSCFVIQDAAWDAYWAGAKKIPPAFANGGQVYLRATIPADVRGMVAPHELTHVMKQAGFQPYLDFINRTLKHLNQQSVYTKQMLTDVADQRGIVLKPKMAREDIVDWYDEFHANIYGDIAANTTGDVRWVLDQVFQDFDAYAAELTELHRQFKASQTGAKNSLKDNQGRELSKQQQEYFKDSKVRDEQGRLVTVYHSSPTAGFTVFNGEQGNGNYRFSEYGTGITFFTDNKEMAASYSNGEGGQYEGYLNITKPYVVDAKGRFWDRISSEFSQGLYEQTRDAFTEEEKAALISLAGWEDFAAFNEEVSRAVRDSGKPSADRNTKVLNSAFWKCADMAALFSMASENFSDDVIRRNSYMDVTTNDIVEKALKDGSYDGVIIKNVIDYGVDGLYNSKSPTGTDYIIFNSNQFKAKDNKKPTEDPDIRYSLKGDKKAVIVYHGSNANFDTFDFSKLKDELGIFFAEAEDSAKQWGNANQYTLTPKKTLVVHQGEEYRKIMMTGETDAEKRKRFVSEGYDTLKIVYSKPGGGETVDWVALTPDVIQYSVKTGDETATYEEDGKKYSLKSLQHDITEGKMFDDLVTAKVFTAKEAERLRKNLDELIAYILPNAHILDMNESYTKDNRPFSTYKPNSDPLYGISLDFSTLCRKRLMTQYVIEQLQLRENRPMSAEEQIAIRSMLLDYRQQEKALQVACAMCYVEAARLKAPKQMEAFFNNTEDIMRKHFAKKDKTFNDKVKAAQAKFKVEHGYEADATKKDMTGKDTKALNEMSAKMRKDYKPNTEQQAIIDKAKSLPRSTFLTAANLTALSIDHPEIYSAYTDHIRASTRSKRLEGDVPYYYGDSRGPVSDSFIESVNAENGMRFDSWSDFQMKHMLDMITAVIDLSVRKSKMHGYTKFPEMVRIFGKTGMMFNLSGVTEGNGFDADGNLLFSDTESIDINEAIKLRKQFPETAGLQCIGVSDDHIRALLKSEHIDYVIPYHTSGMNATLRRMAGIHAWKDYTSTQHARKDPNAKKPADADKWQVEPVWSEFYVAEGKDGYDIMEKTAQRYIDMCHERGLIPKFDQFIGEGYWKLLVDRKMINQETGQIIEQQPVKPIFDFELINREIDNEVSNYDPALEQRALKYVVDNFDAVHKRIKDLKKGHPKKSMLNMANQILQAYAEGSKREEKQSRSNRELLDDMIKQYGAIPKGEKPARNILVPVRTSDDKRVSQTVRTVLEAKATPDAAVPAIEELIAQGDFSYDVYTDKEARAAAEATIRNKGYETALADWLSEVREGKVNKTNTALGWELYNAAATKGDLKTAMTILNGMVQHQRNAAQALQATRILKKMEPDAQLYGIQRSVENLKEELVAKYGKKAPDLEIDEELAKKFLNAKTDEERDEATKEIYMDIGRQMPSTFMDKWNAWRYLAMLGNPRTHVRNVVGNLGFAPVVMAKDMTATAIESAVSFVSGGKMGRTKAMPSLKLLKAAWADYANVADQVTAGGKYSDSAMKNQHIEEGRQIFKFKPLEKARKGNSAAMETEDMWFAQPHYAFALAQYCKAHGVTVDQLRAGKALGNGRDYAIREAQKATYRDTNAFSQAISEFGRRSGDNEVKKGISIAMEGILPFRKTPANILVRGIEYSPVGFVKGMTYDLYKVSKGELTAAEAIDNISAGLTGTGLLGLGIYMAAEGLIRGTGGDDEEEKKFEEMQGHQAYALELPDGKSITLDWLAPEVLPLFIGVNLYETASENKGMTSLSDILSAVKNVANPLLEMSCLQSLNDVFESTGYASSNDMEPFVAGLASAATSYITQIFPTILGQVERSAQDERMTTYPEKNGFLSSDRQYTLGKISAKLPGWDFNQIPYVDAWGRTESTGSKASNIANNFLNPAYTSQIETSEMEEELARLHDEKGDEYSVLPSRPKKYFNVDGERKDLTGEEYVEYATEKGQLSYDILTDLTGQKEYDKLPDAEKARAVELAFEYANAIAKSNVSDYEPDSWVAKALEAKDFSGMDETEYILYKVALNMADQSNNGNGSYDNTEKAAAIASMKSLSNADIAVVLDTKDSYAAYEAGVDMRNLMNYIGEGKKVDVEKLIGAKQAGISENAYFSYTDTLKDVDQPNKNGEYGGTATNAEKAAAVAKMSNLDNEGIAYLWGTDQAHEAYSYGVDMKKYAQFKGVVDSFKGQDKQQQIKSYLKGLNLSAKDYLYLYGTVYSSVKDDADYLYYFGN